MELPPEQENIAGIVDPLQHLTVIIHGLKQAILNVHIIYLQFMRSCRLSYQRLMCLSSAPYAAMDCWICSFVDSFIIENLRRSVRMDDAG